MNSLLSKVVYSHCPRLEGVGRWAVVVEVVEYQAECRDASVWEQQTVDWWMEGLHWGGGVESTVASIIFLSDFVTASRLYLLATKT